MTAQRLRNAALAGFGSAALGFLLLPLFLMTCSVWLLDLLLLGCLALYLYTRLVLRRVLSAEGWPGGVIRTLEALIVANTVLVTASILDDIVPILALPAIGLAMLGLLGLGTAAVIFGFLVLRQKERPDPLLKTFAFLEGVSGLAFLSILGIPMGILLAVAADVALAFLFLGRARDAAAAPEHAPAEA
jgi:hypothetical protein